MSHVKRRRAGFSLVEMLVVLAVGALITTIVVGVFSKAPGRQALDKQTSVVLSLLEHARGLTLSAKNASVYGVHFETAKAVLFTGPTYSAGVASNIVEPVHSLLQISTISLAGGGSDVVFNRLVGDTAQYGTVTFSLLASTTQTKTVTIFPTGLSQSN
ncbi:MAG: prepilin-type N-terminal cleavage/methylation domain-containing protein [bacterium]|nr:prepilin-type N-terminal cleavage/methylation domain-containing protein [bacterium]